MLLKSFKNCYKTIFCEFKHMKALNVSLKWFKIIKEIVSFFLHFYENSTNNCSNTK